jgi:hypothetical protein
MRKLFCCKACECEYKVTYAARGREESVRLAYHESASWLQFSASMGQCANCLELLRRSTGPARMRPIEADNLEAGSVAVAG